MELFLKWLFYRCLCQILHQNLEFLTKISVRVNTLCRLGSHVSDEFIGSVRLNGKIRPHKVKNEIEREYKEKDPWQRGDFSRDGMR
jgi:hypothetical protein